MVWSGARRQILPRRACRGFTPPLRTVAGAFTSAALGSGSFLRRTAVMINDLWYKNAIVYCLSVGSFQDANGDGVGDFQGLVRRLDYLQGLGVTAVWLMPFQTSPCRDGGYDIADYYNVDPRYGTLGDFVEFTHAASQRGMRVLIDLVVNHTSDRHPWFRSARSSPDSPFRDWYMWSSTKNRFKEARIIFLDTETSNWTWD